MAIVKVSKDIVAPVAPVFQEFAGTHLGAAVEMIAFERNRMYTITRYQGDVRIDMTFRFEPVRGATRVTFEMALHEQDAQPGSIESLNGDLSALKASLETPHPPAFRRLG